MRASITAVLGSVLIACSVLPARQLGYAFPVEGQLAALPVLLTDTQGLVVSLDQAPAGFAPLIDDGMANVPGDPNAMVIHWIGGTCDEHVDITEEGSGSVMFVVRTTVRPGACDLAGVSRALLLQLSRPADMQALGVRFER